ncbi:hypothetical protein [Paraburkholderia phenoliruptrix]|uniref:hypothetical protein n=1 Tax=Paraburkholderia phenoliruptrix TaxID=252970 RepID=UPI0028569761|nr:hypothetical protein [Paraburkholderia phenoliruptrix]MDR6388445.1 hypothetical protein [Paraburkholderia phenoliruptrix]MDR6423773.1 hypothetical protein [Paraburkholderia phenoliruptrix]
MDALTGFLLFGVSLAAILATTESSGKLWWAGLLGTLAGGPVVIVAVSMTMPGSAGSVLADTLALVVPVIFLCAALSSHSSPEIAAGNSSP